MLPWIFFLWAQNEFILKDVTVIQPADGVLLHRQNIKISGGCIETVGEAAPEVGPGAGMVEGGGLFVLPGFVDTHAHVAIVIPNISGGTTYREDLSARVLALLLAHGVTLVRNPGAPTEEGVKLREAVAGGGIAGPDIVTAGRILNRSAPRMGPFVATDTPEKVREEVRAQAAAGVDFIKVYGTLKPGLIEAAIDEAHRHGLQVVGHLQATSWTTAARLGIDAITHGVPWSADYLPPQWRETYRPTLLGRIYWLEHIEPAAPVVQEMLAVLAGRVTVDPTLIVYHNKFWGDDPRYRRHPRLDLVPAELRAFWEAADFTKTWQADDFRRARAVWPKLTAWVRQLHDAGILLTAGCDVPNPWVVPGYGYHEELRLLGGLGLSPMEVLRIATFNGAQCLGRGGYLGRIAAGYQADLVVLTANPLEDLSNTTAIRWVIRDGILYDPKVLIRFAGSEN